MRRLAIAIVLILSGIQAAEAKEWAQKMFSVTKHDFGNVARGAKAEFAFEIENLYQEDVHIADVRTSCGCTTPTITKPTLKSWEKGTIVATLNTRSYVGQRHSTLTVVIDKPFYAEVPLSLSGVIHSDVDFQPGSVAFGDVAVGTPTEQTVTVTHQGRGAWAITDVRSTNSNFEVELGEPTRLANQTVYKMTVRLRGEMPAGAIDDHLTIVTSDQRLPTVSLPVEGRVVPPLSVSPSPLFVGTLQPGQTATKQLVITGKEPFKLLAIRCDHPGVEFKTAPDVVRKVHLVPVIFTAGTATGEINYTIEIETDLPLGGKTTCPIRGTIEDASASSVPTAAVRGLRRE
jgi:hypothetical protein